MAEAVVFDFDGVLADSEPLHLATYQEVFAGLGATLTREDYYARYLGFDDEGVFRAFGEAQGWPMDEARIAALIRHKAVVFEEVISTTNVLYPGARECVERLAREFPLGIASGALRQEIETILGRAGLLHHFRFIVAAGETGHGKPAPDPYLRAAELHGVDPADCLAIEDSHAGLESARTAGLRTIGIATTYPRETLTADVVIDSLDEVTRELVRTIER